MLENMHGFFHVSDVMNANAIGSLIEFVVAIIAVKMIITGVTAMVRDDARKMDKYQRTVEGYTGNGDETPEA